MKDKFITVKNCVTFEIVNITNIALAYQSNQDFSEALVVSKHGDRTRLKFNTTADCKQFCENLAAELNAKPI